MGSDNFIDKAWLPPMRLTYSQKNKLVPTKLYYKCQMFLWWRLFSSFADSLKVFGSGIHFKLIESLLVVERRLCRGSFSLLKLINRHFSRKSHYNFVEAAGILHPTLCVLFPIFFFLVPLPLSYRQAKFRTSSTTRSSEAVTGGVL